MASRENENNRPKDHYDIAKQREKKSDEGQEKLTYH